MLRVLIVVLQVVVENDRVPAQAQFLDWIEQLSASVPVSPDSLTVRVVGPAESRQLNSQYRGKDSATNVLSFPSQLPEYIEPDYLGDLVICAEVVEREAGEQHKSLDAHWAHMLVHGVLHLLGYDHILDQEADKMEALETKILTGMGFPEPYAS